MYARTASSDVVKTIFIRSTPNGRFPVTLYDEQWVRLLDAADDLLAFLEKNKDKLKLKQR